ncbi:MAG: YncE family protein [Prevotellaceae bacterium]|jgi:DNA-binding beta-propeller fold protein YncE|nr:YncE family protein [Prevotellaceae bacterium]
MKTIKYILYVSASAAALLAASCRKEAVILEAEVEVVTSPDSSLLVNPSDTSANPADSAVVVKRKRVLGFYLLNEGNMSSNKSTLDYFDYATGEYHRNIYADANPTVPREMGDVGNDLEIYGSKLYAIINCSNKVEVMDKHTAKRLGQVNIPNCRYIRFHEGYAYVTSYAGPVKLDPEYEQTGYVAKVDTATLQVVAQCLVGFQPDELEIVGSKIYVANSGGYRVSDKVFNYENTVSVIDIPSFTETKRIEVAINLHRLRADRHGNLWVTSRGNYFDVPSRLFWIDTKTDTYGGMIKTPATELYLDGDSLYLYSTEWSWDLDDWRGYTFGIVDVAKRELVTRSFLADGEAQNITMPYGIMVHPNTKDIYLTDAANFTNSGALMCFDRYGKKKWQVGTGDIPAHFALLYE